MKKNILYFLAGAFILQGCADPVERTAEYLQSGKSLYQDGKYDKAKIEFRNALQINNKVSDAYFHLALIAEQKESWKAMYRNLKKTINLSPDNLEARLKLAKLYLLSGEVDKSSEELEIVLNKSENNIEAIALQGAVFLKQGKIVEALAAADKVLAIDPAHVDAISLKAVIYMGKKEFSQAIAVVDSVLLSKPNELSLNLLKLQVYLKAKDLANIEKSYLSLIKRYTDEHNFSYALAQFYISQQREAEALSVLQNVIDNNKEDIKPKLVLVDYLQATDVRKAEDLLQKYIKESPDEVLLYMNLAKVYIAQKKITEAKVPLNWVVEQHGAEKEGLHAKVMLANFAAQEKKYTVSLEMVNEVLEVDARHYDALLLKARLNLMDGQYDQAITDLRGVLRDYSESDAAAVLMAKAYLKKESPILAHESFRKALDLNPGNFAAVMPVVSHMVKNKGLFRAEEILKKALDIKPNHLGALQALAQIKLLNKDWQGAQKVADLISAQPNGKSISYYLGGKVSQGQKAYQEAIDKYKKALAITPSLKGALASIAACYQALDNKSALFAYFDEFSQKNPENFQSSLLKARVYAVEKDWNNALATLNKGQVTWPKVPQFYLAIASVYKVKNERAKVIASYEKGLSEIPDSYQIMLLLTSTYEAEKNYLKAIEVYEKLITKKPNVDIAVNNLVALLLDYAPSTENISRALVLAERFESSKQPYFLDTYGWALLKNDKLNESVVVFKKVTSMAPSVAVFQYHLGLSYFRTNEYLAAEKALKISLLSADKQKNEFIERDKVSALLEELKNKKTITPVAAIQ